MSESSRAAGQDKRQDKRARRMRRWAWWAVAAQVVFVASWLLAQAWQGSRYSFFAHSISDMYAQTAPGGLFLVIMFTLCGAVTMWFTVRSVWPSFRPAGWTGAVGTVLLSLSIFGLGDLLSPFERLGCRLADPGCTASSQVSNAGGAMDSTLSTIGVFAFVLAALLLSFAMRRTPGWEKWAWPARVAAALPVVFGLLQSIGGMAGFFERLIALSGAVFIAALARGIRRRSRRTAVSQPAGSPQLSVG